MTGMDGAWRVSHKWTLALVAALLTLLALTSSARATTNPACPAGSVTWVGGHMAPGDPTPNNWNVAANWSNDIVPTAATNVCLDNTSETGSYTVNIDTYGSGQSLANSITVGGTGPNVVTLALDGVGGGVQVASPLTLTNQSAGAGVLSTGAITLGSEPNAITAGSGNQPGIITVQSGSLVNHGTITSQQYDGTDANTISGGFDNEGTLNVTDSLNVNGPDVNGAGTINIAAGNELNVDYSQDDSSFTQTGGTINNQGTFELFDGTFTASGGTSTGNPLQVTADRSGVAIDLAGSSTDTVHAQTGGANLTGDIGAGATLWISGEPGYTQGLLNLAGAYTNHGTLELGAGAGTDETEGNVSVNSGSLTNAGTLISNFNGVGGGGPNAISGTFVNTGTMSIQGGLNGNGAITNTGTITLAQGMQISGTSFSQAAPGSLSVSLLANSSALSNPVVQLSGAAALGGALTVTTSGSQTANVTLVKAQSVAGTFAPVTFVGQAFTPAYTANSVTLDTGASPTTTNPPTTTTPPTTTNPPAPTTTTTIPTTTTKPAATAKAGFRGISGKAGGFSVKLSCPSGGAACPAVTVKGTVTEKVKGKKGKKGKTKVVTVASGMASLAAGSSRALMLTLNKPGLALLKGHEKLQVTVTITERGKMVKRTKTNVLATASHKRKKK